MDQPNKRALGKSSPELLLQDRLNSVGLQPDYWTPIFLLEFNVQYACQMQYLKEKEYETLTKYCRHEWERSALKVLIAFPTCDNYQVYREKRLKQATERHEQSQKILKDLQDMKSNGRNLRDSSVKDTVFRLREALDIPDDKWIHQSKGATFEEILENLQRCIDDVNTGLCNKKAEPQPIRVVQRASGGLLLKGILLTNKNNDLIEERKQLVNVQDIVINGPVIPVKTTAVEVSSQYHLDSFHRTLKSTGILGALSLNAPIPIVAAGANVDVSYGSEKETESKINEGLNKVFHSRIVCSIVPTVSVELNPEKLTLCENAVKMLKDIESLEQTGADKGSVLKRCLQFLQKYGSHVNTNVAHLGGVFSWVATYSRQTSISKEKVTSLVVDCVNAFMAMSYSGYVLNIGGSISGAYLSSKANLDKKHELVDISSTQLTNITLGGPPETSSLHLWKTGLIADSDTWAVIDRGEYSFKSFSKFLGIWDLVRSETSNFSNSSRLSELLYKTWKDMSGLSIPDKNRFDAQINEIKAGITGAVKSTKDPDKLKMHYCEILEKINQNVEKGYQIMRNWGFWLYILREENSVSEFLLKITKETLTSSNTQLIKYYIEKLITPVANRDFLRKTELLRWLEDQNRILHKYESVFTEVDTYDSTDHFIEILDKRYLPLVQCSEYQATSEEEKRKIWRDTTCQMALGIHKLFKCLEQSEKHIEVLLFKTLLHDKLSYSLEGEKHVFEIQIKADALSSFNKLCCKRIQKFNTYMCKSKLQAEAYVFHLLLESICNTVEEESQGRLFIKVLQPLRSFVAKEINSVLCTFERQTPQNVAVLARTLNLIIEKNVVPTQADTLRIPEIEELYKLAAPARDAKARCSSPKVKFDSLELSAIMSHLGVDDARPGKFTLQQLATLEVVDKSKYTLTDMPLAVLREIIMNDFRWRDKTIHDLQTKSWEEKIDVTDDMSLFLAGEVAGEKKTMLKFLHPSDIFLALFLCCDENAKKLIFDKLLMLKQAVPLIYPSCVKNINSCLSMMPLRFACRECKQRDSFDFISFSSVPMKFVSFIRLKQTCVSKSKLLNDIMCDQTHACFHHSDLLTKISRRTLSEGLIEAAWFLPSVKSDTPFEEVLGFLNLRGDALCHPDKVHILSYMSSLVVVTVDTSTLLDDGSLNVLKTLYRSQIKIVLFLTCKSTPTEEVMDKIRRDLGACLLEVCPGEHTSPPIKLLRNFDETGIKSSETLRKDLRKLISTVLKSVESKRLDTLASDMAKDRLVQLDESFMCNWKGKQLAEQIYQELIVDDDKRLNNRANQNVPLISFSESVFPLQGDPWKRWANHNKDLYKYGGTSSTEAINQIKVEMEQCREEQVQKCMTLAPAVKCIIKTVFQTVNNEQDASSVIGWLKLFLDSHSRKVIPVLTNKYHVAWNQVREYKKTFDARMENIKQLEIAAVSAEKELEASSFGMEHILREFGQIYESVLCSNTKVDQNTLEAINTLPEFVSNLLIMGHAIEIMDGDAVHIPLTWITAILNSLECTLGVKKVMVISVLGIQSSGKSTLLNAMFGLQFDVRAGRCTKGIFARLIPVKSLPFDYFLVVDTEGIRAQESHDQYLDRDNKFATLVIGMADITVINIKGESSAELKDVLQIAVHAFLRIKLANKQMKMHNKCVFIHQNVDAGDAKQQMQRDINNLQIYLDEMTRVAAEEEHINNIQFFNEVIDFNANKHIWFCPNLWSGNPPMAPYNPAYSDSVQEVKQSLLEIALEKNTALTLSDLSIRIEDIWKGILSENFVFSFRSSLEIKAYNRMESHFYQIMWRFETFVLEQLEDVAGIEIEQYKRIEDLESCQENVVSKLKQTLEKENKLIRQELENYFEKSDLQDTVEMWKNLKLAQCEDTTFDLIARATKVANQKIDSRKLAIQERKGDTRLEIEVNRKAIEMAEKFKGRSHTQEDLRVEFEKMWIPWANSVAEEKPIDNTSILRKLDETLKERLRHHGNLIKTHLNLNPLSKPFERKLNRLEGSINISFIVEGTDICIKENLIQRAKQHIVGKSNQSDRKCETKALSITNQILMKIDEYIEAQVNSDVRVIRLQYANEIIHHIVSGFEKHNNSTENFGFTFLPNFIVKMAIHACRYAAAMYDKMVTNFEKKYGRKQRLEASKQRALNLFFNTVNRSIEDVVAADLMYDRIFQSVTEIVRKGMGPKIVREILSSFSNTKYQAMLEIMDDLATKDSIDEYTIYITDSTNYVYNWIDDYVNKKIFQQDENGVSRYLQLAEGHVAKIVTCLRSSVTDATKVVINYQSRNMRSWVKQFCLGVEGKLPILPEELEDVASNRNCNVLNFQALLLRKLDELSDNVSCKFKSHSHDDVVSDHMSPCKTIVEKLWGCSQQCPFCLEPCQKTDKSHLKRGESHSCIQHRPGGIGGTRWNKNNKLIVESCNFIIQSKILTFSCKDCYFKCRDSGKCTAKGNEIKLHKCTKYKKYFPDWDIAPSAEIGTSDYWMWFLKEYQLGLCFFYSADFPDIPGSWQNMNKKEALCSLRKILC